MIEQSLNTNIKELEPIYWLIEDSVYKNDIPKAKSMLTVLLYIAKYNPKLITQGLQVPYKQRLKQLSQELLNGHFLQKIEAIEIKSAIESRKIPFKLEKELKDYLVEHPEKLSNVLEENIRITGVEVDTDFEYKCDIVAESSDKFFPIELKIGQGTHAVVSQCSKYCYYFYRKLRYDRFKQIQGVVIANGFDSWSINELRRNGIWIFDIVPENEKDISLLQILQK